jgi:hypothetical protein
MERIIKKSVSIPFPIIGIPIRDLYTPYVIMPSNITCNLNIRIFEKASKNSAQIGEGNLVGSEAIFSYINGFLSELGYRAINGKFLVECTDSPPLIPAFAVVSMEILKAVLKMEHSDYITVLNVLALFDEKKLGLDPGYSRALRYAYMYNAVCIARGYDELIKLGSRKLLVKKLSEVACTRVCNTIDNPYDTITLSLFYKLSTHVIGLLAQAVKEWNEEKVHSLRKFLDLYMVLEGSIVKEYIGGENLPIGYSIKPVVDYNSIKFYKVNALV